MLVFTHRRAWFAAMLFFALFTFAQPKFDTWFLSPHYLLKFRNNTVTAHNLNNNVSIYDQNSQSSIVIDSIGKIEVMIDERNLYDTLGNIIKNNLKCSNTGMGALLPFGKNKYINFMSCDYDTLKYRIISKLNTIEVSKPKTFFPFLDSTTKDRQNWGLYSTFYYPISYGASNCSGIRTIIQSFSGNIGVLKTDTSENKIKFNILQLSDITPPVFNLNFTIQGIGFSNDYKQFLVATENYLNLYDFDDIDSKTFLTKKIRIPDDVFSGYLSFITFSPNNKFVYLFGSNGFPSLTTSAFYQLNLETNSFSKIYEKDRNYIMGTLPLGIDGKIYLTDNQAGSFSIVHQPDLPFPDCNYEAEALKISPNYTYFLVSKKVENYYGRKYDFKITQTCIGDSVLFEGPKMATDDKYIWRFADGFTTTAPGVKRHISQEQKIHLRYNYCDVYDTAWVPPAKPLAISDTFLCAKNTLLLPPKTEAVLINNKTISGVVTINNGTNYALLANECFTVNDTFKVEIVQRQAKPFGTDTVICHQTELMLQAKAPSDYTFRWSDNSSQKEVKITESGRYSLIRSNRCFVDTSTINVTFVAPTDISKISNVITPNGDGINDTWLPLTENAEKYQLQIYNRYGTLVFESTTWNQVWNASNSPDGIYFYHISYTDCYNQIKNIKGTVMLVR